MRGKDLSGLAWQPSTKEMVAYEAIDGKGKGYYLIRNDHNPSMMFVLADGFSRIPGWYSDKTGTIRRVS